MTRSGGSWAAFLALAFGLVGLIGAFGTYASQIPFERALARSAALDAALAASRQPDAAAALERLRPALGDSADAILSGSGGVAERVEAERNRVFRRFEAEAHATGFHLRIQIAVFTAAAALFGVAVLSIAQRAKSADRG
jgi:hypothetical protein